jgi:hypothetical protein
LRECCEEEGMEVSEFASGRSRIRLKITTI